MPKWVIQDLFNCLHVAVLRAVLSFLLSLSLWNQKGTVRFWDEGKHSEAVVGTGFLGALGEHGTQEGCSPPSRVTAEQRSLQPPACSTLEDVSLARLGAWRSADQKGQKAVHLPQTASPHHYPCVLLPAHEEFKWNSKARSLTVGKQCCTLTTPDYRKKHRLVQKQNSRNKNYERWERLGLGRNWHQAACVWLQSNLLGLGE